jgi:hypothetical protein
LSQPFTFNSRSVKIATFQMLPVGKERVFEDGKMTEQVISTSAERSD